MSNTHIYKMTIADARPRLPYLHEIQDNIIELPELSTKCQQHNVLFKWKPSMHYINSRYINDSGWMNLEIRRFNVKCERADAEKDVDNSKLCPACLRTREWIQAAPAKKRFATEWHLELKCSEKIPKNYCYSNGSDYFNDHHCGPCGHRSWDETN